MRYYYKTKDNKNVLSLKEPLFDPKYTIITEDEYNRLANSVQIPTLDATKMATLARVSYLKKQLASTDYKAIKYAEGLISEEDYAEVKSQRQS